MRRYVMSTTLVRAVLLTTFAVLAIGLGMGPLVAESFGQTTGESIVQISEETPGEQTPGIAFEDGRLTYPPGYRGDRVPDFSTCGYAGANISIPSVEIRMQVLPAEGDDTDRIQTAIDHVATLPIDASGFRGAVFLAAGTFEVSGSLHLRDSGVVLRGAGAAAGGTVIRATGSDRRTLIRIHGQGQSNADGPVFRIADRYVPVGANALRLETIDGLKIGDSVIVTRPSTKEWIAAIRCDIEGLGWRAGSRDLRWRRVVRRIDGNTVHFDSPLTNSIDERFGGGKLQREVWPGLIRRVGVEDLLLVSDYRAGADHDEEHAWHGITMNSTTDAWVRRVGFKHFAGGAVLLNHSTQRVTVEDCISQDPISEVGGYRRHSFFTQGQQCLFLRCWSEQGCHDFSVGHCAPGPNAFVHCYADKSLGDSGPLESWAAGVLFDNVRIDGGDLKLCNRWSNPPRAGWSAANCMIWQCQASTVVCDAPPTAHNWAIGIWATPAGTGHIEGISDFVKPISLYQQQLQERIGEDRAAAVGPFLLKPVGATNPSVEQAQRFVAASNEPARQLKDLIRERWARVPDIDLEFAMDARKLERNHTQPPLQKQMTLQNGWLATDEGLLVGGHLTPTWWRGKLEPDAAPEMGHSITRFAPGRVGAGLTDEMSDVLAHMRSHQLASYDHHYGLWYDRRRDDHLMVRRSDGEVAPPFYEQPFARSGTGAAWDGLSRYDLTRFNPWYWQRLAEFAALCDQHGHVLFHQAYFQHNILEAGAHWADAPWRPANNINDVRLPEPPPYVGDKRIFLAHQFYDVSDPKWRSIHENYIRKGLENFADTKNVIQLTSAEYSGPLSFVQFWLDTIVAWERETGKQVLLGLSCTKDVQDAILADPTRRPHVDVIDIRYWMYASDFNLYAPLGGKNLSPRQHQRQTRSKSTSFASIVRAVREYRTRHPEKAVSYHADIYCRSGRDGWAILMGGGSLCNVPQLPDSLRKAVVGMLPSHPLMLVKDQWCLAAGEREFLIYSAARDEPTVMQLPQDGDYEYVNVDPATGKLSEPKPVRNDRIPLPADVAVIWVRPTSSR